MAWAACIFIHSAPYALPSSGDRNYCTSRPERYDLHPYPIESIPTQAVNTMTIAATTHTTRPPSSLEIGRNTALKPIEDVAGDMGLGGHLLESYGRGGAQIDLAAIDDPRHRPQA